MKTKAGRIKGRHRRYLLRESCPEIIFHIRLGLASVCPSPAIQSPEWKMLCNYCASSCTIIPPDVHNCSFYARKLENFNRSPSGNENLLLETAMCGVQQGYICLFVGGRGGWLSNANVPLLTSQACRGSLHILASQRWKKKGRKKVENEKKKLKLT